MKQLGKHLYRAALWALVIVVLASLLATVPGILGASPSYTLTGYVRQPGGAPVPAGVQVDLVSRATGTVYTTPTVGAGGQFSFTSAGTQNALVPGYWSVYVPPQGNGSWTGCKPCAALPVNENPQWSYESATELTTTSSPTIVTGVQVLAYNTTLSGTVSQGGSPEAGASVRLLAPTYNGLVLANNTTASNGAFSLKVPFGTWVLQSTAPGPSPNYVNSTKVVISSRSPPAVNPQIQRYLVAGNLLTTSGAPVASAGNATLFDGYNGYIYTSATAPGGYYQLGTYAGNFSSGSQSFDVILSSSGYSTAWYPLTVTSGSPVTRDVTVPTIAPSQQGVYTTTLNFSALNTATGAGNVTVRTNAVLGNDTVFPNLPNGTVGQLWAQLGLDFAHSLSFPSTSLPTVYALANASGPFFPVAQALLTVNGTGFVAPTTPETLASWTSTCSGSCGLANSATLGLNWSGQYALNGTVAKDSSTYSIGFNFRHPSSNLDVFNYTLVLPAGYVLQAGTAAPANTALVADGPGGTWTSFTLSSQASTTPGGTAQFTIVKYAGLTAVVNATVPGFFGFSSRNVLNQTEGNYTVEVGVGQNVTFSAQNSIYPAGTNGTRFAWTFGDLGTATTSTPSASHIYTSPSGATPENGTLTVTSSGGRTNSTVFHVWVASGPVTAGIASNATANETKSAGGVTYLFLKWGTTLKFNATPSTAAVSPSAPVKGVLSVASFALTSKGFTQSANYSAGQGAYFGSNFTVQFLGAGAYLSNGVVNGTLVPIKGWQYNLSLTVWSGGGQSAKASLVILVNDTQAPVSAFQILNAAGKPVSGTGLVAGSNASTLVQLNGANASDPNNGSITKYYWLVTNAGDSAIHLGVNATAVRPYPLLWLAAQSKAYTVNLTVWDLNNNHGYSTQSLTVNVNTSITPILQANNLTGPAKLTDGSAYTFWVNVTVGGGTRSVAQNVEVAFYMTSPGGTSRTYVAGSPGSVRFFNYTSPGVPNSVAMSVGSIASLAYNTTVRAQITWTPGLTGNFVLYANATASNEFSGDIGAGSGVKSMSVTLSPNPTTQLLEYVAIGVVVVVVLLLIIVYYRRRSGRGPAPKTTTSRSGLERGSRRSGPDDDDES